MQQARPGNQKVRSIPIEHFVNNIYKDLYAKAQVSGHGTEKR